MKNVDLDEPTSFLDHVSLGCTQRVCKVNENVFDQYRENFKSPISATATGKNLTPKQLRGPTTWKDMLNCELANTKTEQLYTVSTPGLDDHHFKKEELESFGEVSKVCSQMVLKCLYLARIGRPDILWSVNELARAITTWTQACDRRLGKIDFTQSSQK